MFVCLCLLAVAGTATPSTTHCRVAAGLLLEVSHCNSTSSPARAVSGPRTTTRSGATEQTY